MIVSLSAPNLAQPYPAHIEDLAAVGVLGVLVHICSSWCLNRLSPGFASGLENGGKGQCQIGGVDANSVQFECDKQFGRRQTAAVTKAHWTPATR